MNDLNAINIRNLLFFISVFDAQSFSVVARREGVSASMVSRSVQQLEDALGQQLFYRNKMEFGFSSTRWMTPEEVASGAELDNKNAVGFHIPRMWDKILDINKCHFIKSLET